jgi:D-alanyl-D-alanine carboxypeptidase
MPALTIVLQLLTLALGSGQAADPWARPEETVRAYVAAFNAGEPQMRQFLERHADGETALEARLARYRDLKEDLRSLTLRAVRRAADGGIEAVVATGRGGTATLGFVLTGATPRKLRGIRVALEGGGEEPDPPLAPRDEVTALGDIQALVEWAVKADEYSGAALIGRDGRIVWQGAWGEADKDRAIPNTIDTRFNIGSINKSFTAVALAQLVAAGKLSPTDVVGQFLPEYPNAVVRERVTLQHLLDMRSGIGDIFGPKYEQTPKASLRTLADYLPLFADAPLQFEPGQGRAYSNGGYIVLGLIIEQVSGMPYDAYLKAHVFDPAGMRATGFPAASRPLPDRAVGYTTRLGPPRRDNRPTLPDRGSSAGGAYATAPDLLRYAEALAAGRLASPDAMQTLGRQVRGIGIAGGAPGLNATLDHDVNGYTVVVLSNYDPPSAERVARGIRRVLQAVDRWTVPLAVQ